MAPIAKYAAFLASGQKRFTSVHQGHQREIDRWRCPITPPLILSKNGHSTFELFMENDQAVKDARPVETPKLELDESLAIPSALILNFVAIIWGTQHSVIKMVVEDCDPASFSFARFALATLIASPFTPNLGNAITEFLKDSQREEKNITRTKDQDQQQNMLAWRWGIEMGFWMFLGYAFQAIGLEYTTAQRSGFLLYLNVKFVPFFANALFGRKISIPTWASAFIALFGTALIAYDGTSLALNVGDLWSVAAAAASAMFILRLESASNAVKNSAALNAASLWVVTITAFLWCIGNEFRAGIPIVTNLQTIVDNVVGTVSAHPLELLYLGGVTTAVANYLQTKAQKGISAERASLIYALDPVYGELRFSECFSCTVSSFSRLI
jgi:drug/metabolite transporter (DMT)-like permease